MLNQMRREIKYLFFVGDFLHVTDDSLMFFASILLSAAAHRTDFLVWIDDVALPFTVEN